MSEDMEIDEAIANAEAWARSARALEKNCRNGGYRFMASDAGNEAETLETLVNALKCRKDETDGKYVHD